MRKHLAAATLLTLMLLPALAFGQIKMQKARFAQKGKFHIGGSFSYASKSYKMTEPTESDEVDRSSMSFRPKVGYFVIPNLEIGGIIDYRSTDQDESETSSFGLGPEIAYYYKATPVVFPNAHGSFIYAPSVTTKHGDNETDGTAQEIRAGIGVAVAFGHKVGGVLSVDADYVMMKSTTEGKDGAKDTTYEDNGMELGVGFSIYF